MAVKKHFVPTVLPGSEFSLPWELSIVNDLLDGVIMQNCSDQFTGLGVSCQLPQWISHVVLKGFFRVVRFGLCPKSTYLRNIGKNVMVCKYVQLSGIMFLVCLHGEYESEDTYNFVETPRKWDNKFT